MAQDQNKNPNGGNKPKPGTTSGTNAGQSAKDKSRAQSRPMSGKAPSGKSGQASGANKTGGPGGNKPKPKPGGRPPQSAAPRKLSGAMMAWGAVGLVVVIIVVLVIVKASSGSSSSNAAYTPVTAAPASVVHDVTNIPTSVYNTVGVTSSTVPVTPPTILSNQPPMTLNGKSPAMLYYGAEYCPYCAAERWAMTAALSRFGTWSNLQITASSHTDVNPETHTFSYHGATLTSPYITFKGVEQYTNVPASTAGAYTNLQNPTAEEKANIVKYSSSKFNPSASSSGGISFPYVNINNVALFSGASYSPGVLAGQTWEQIASGLSDPSNPATQAIVSTANYMSAAICASTKNAPAAVCTSSGVKAAAKALKLS
jgi:Domain of unknown function (DUF929)